MFGSQTIEVAVGLAFVYLLLSLMCTTLNEWVARVLAMRSNTLEEGILNLLKDRELTNKLYAHPLVQSLYRKSQMDKILGRSGYPSYIPSRIFALALLDIVAPPKGNVPQVVENIQTSIQAIQNVSVRTALLALINASQGNIDEVVI